MSSNGCETYGNHGPGECPFKSNLCHHLLPSDLAVRGIRPSAEQHLKPRSIHQGSRQSACRPDEKHPPASYRHADCRDQRNDNHRGQDDGKVGELVPYSDPPRLPPRLPSPR